MHEYSIVQALLEGVQAEARARDAIGVRKVQVRIGELSGVEIDLLAAAFDTFREGTICSGARLEVQRVEAAWSCPRCDRGLARGEALICPGCKVPARLARGDEILLDRIEMEVP